jgi:hypothetical protein
VPSLPRGSPGELVYAADRLLAISR